ncbi:recombinase family protein [Planococcus halocryophilus]|uniref:recombinase family protein n=1 Tax=Planococcus halocryophilus TaxID=1215089 RepID=UPI001F0FF5F9|nr:recombinase family protein [Planococcus halocryophilus]MCH4825794.1 recombinase family protein [Planococcus halocryophilus]
MKQIAVVYTRVSTDKLIQKTSLTTQKEYYTDYCERKGYDLFKIYADEGLTGTNVRREAFREMLYKAGLDYTRNDNGYDWFSKSTRVPEFNILVCKDVSRFSRGSVQGQMIIKLLKDMGVNTVFENSGMSTFSDNWQMNIGILFNIAENESASMSKRIKFAKKHKRDKKVYAPSRIPYGYTRNTENEIVIHPEQSEIVKYIFARYLEVGSNIITNELNEKGVLSQTGVRFTPDKVTRIISNTVFYGDATVNKSNKKSVTDTKREKNEKSDFVTIPNVVDPIITKEEWKEANRIRVSRINKSSKRGRKTAKNDVYYSKLICSSCGSRLVRHMGEKEKISYICQSRRKGGNCKSRSIAINVINKFMRRTELSHMTNSMGDSAYYNELMKRLENEKLHLSETQMTIQKQMETLNLEIDSIIDKYMVLDDSDKFKQRLIDRSNLKEEEITKLEVKLSEINIASIERIQQKVDSKKEMIETIFKNKNFTQEEKLNLLNKVDVSDYTLTFHFSMPTYEEEVKEFNELFTMTPIASDMPYNPFAKETFRRDHKAAREHWQVLDDESRDNEAFYNS